MKKKLSSFLRKGQFPPMLALGVMPICIIILVHIAPQAIGALPVLLAVYVLLAWIALFVPGRFRAAYGAVGCAALMLLGLRTLPVITSVSPINSSTVSVNDGLFTLPVPIGLCALLLYSLQFSAWPHDREIPFNWCATGIVMHMAGQFVVYLHRNLTPSPYDQAAPWLIAGFIAYMPLMLLSLNRMSMRDAAQNRQRAPLQVRRRNTVITLAFFLLSLLVAATPVIMRTVERIWTGILTGIATIIWWLVNLMPAQSAPGGGGVPAESGMFGPMEAAEPSLLAQILEAAMTLFAAAAAVVIAFFVLHAIWKKLLELLKTLLEKMRAYLSTVSEDYEDEVTDTREDGSLRTSLLNQLRQQMSFLHEKRLPPAERIRFRYRRLLKKHPNWHASQTARESLPLDPAALYERARYSNQAISPEDAEAFLQETKNL